MVVMDKRTWLWVVWCLWYLICCWKISEASNVGVELDCPISSIEYNPNTPYQLCKNLFVMCSFICAFPVLVCVLNDCVLCL